MIWTSPPVRPPPLSLRLVSSGGRRGGEQAPAARPPGGCLCPGVLPAAPLTTLTLIFTRDPLIPLDAGNGLALDWEGRTLELTAPDRPGLLGDLARLLQRLDPDLVLSDGGDEDHSHPQPLEPGNRDAPAPGPERGPVDRKSGAPAAISPMAASSTRAPPSLFTAAGAWTGAIPSTIGSPPGGTHADQPHRPDAPAAGGPGLPGTLITSMQLSRALADGILIPWRKGEPEGFKTAGHGPPSTKAASASCPRRASTSTWPKSFRLHVPHHHGAA